jgi:hypothetical protein
MKSIKNLFLLLLTAGSLLATGCLHIVEELTTKKNGSGSYKLTFDMSEMKDMMDMVKSMAADSLSADSAAMPEIGNPMAMLGGKSESGAFLGALRSIPGITNVAESNDTVQLVSSFSFDYADNAALNRALHAIYKDRFDKKITDPYKNAKKKFQRFATADLGTMFRAAFDEASDAAGEDDEGMGDMAGMFFSTMTYKQVYIFPDRTVKKSTNPLSEISADGHTVTIEMKPFDKEQQASNPSVATEIQLKSK